MDYRLASLRKSNSFIIQHPGTLIPYLNMFHAIINDSATYVHLLHSCCVIIVHACFIMHNVGKASNKIKQNGRELYFPPAGFLVILKQYTKYHVYIVG